MATQFDVMMGQLEAVDAWQEIRRDRPTLIKANGLYPLLETLIKEKHSIATTAHFSKHKIKDEENFYYLAKFPEDSTEDSFAGYTCVERHLRIDKDYSDSSHQPGLSPAHFSEYWQHESSDTRIIVHVYYLDRIQTVQAKTDKGETVSLTEPLIRKIKRNAAAGFKLYRQLLEERDQRLKRLIEDSDKTLERLTTLSIDLASEGQKKEYMSVGRTFVKMVEDINQYAGGNFPKDRRGDFITARISHIETYSQQAVVSAPAIIEKPEMAVSSRYVSVSPVSAKETQKISEEQLKFEEIKTRIDDLERQKDKGWTVESYQIGERLRDALFDLAFIEATSGLSRKPLVKAAKKMLSSLSEPRVLAETVAKAGDLKSFKVLLPMLSQSNCALVYGELLRKLCDTSEEGTSTAQNIGKICEYLFENNKLYAVMVRAPFLMVVNKDLQISVLCSAFMCRSLGAFKMLLRHGCDPNSAAYRDNIRCYSMPKVMALYGSTNNRLTDYFDCLFEHGLVLDVSYEGGEVTPMIPAADFFQYLDSRNTSQMSLRLLKAKDVENTSLVLDLNFAVWAQSWQVARLLVPHSHLAAITLALKSLANTEDYFANGRTVAPTPVDKGVLIFPNIETRRMALEAEFNENHLENKVSIRYVIARKTASDEVYRLMEELYQAFIDKCKQCSKRAILQHMKSLMNLIAGTKMDPIYKSRVYDACLTLLIQKARLDLASSQEALNLLQRMAICYAISDRPQFQPDSIMIYRDIISFAEKSIHADELIKSKPYLAACKTLLKPPITAVITPAYQRMIEVTFNTAGHSVQHERPEPGSIGFSWSG